MLWVYLASVNASIMQIYDAAGKRWINSLMYAAWSVIFISSCYTLIPDIGVFGLMYSHLIAEVVLLLIQSIYFFMIR